MRKHAMLAALAAVGCLYGAPVANASFAFINEGRDGNQVILLWETGPAQDTTIDASIPGNPALTADQPGAQRVDITDPADAFDFVPVPQPPPGCWTPSPHHVQCLADPQKQAAWRTSTCYTTGCYYPAPSGLLVKVIANLDGEDVRLRDDPDGEPIDLDVYPRNASGTRNVTLSSARFVRYEDWYGGRDRLFLDLEEHTPLPELHEPSQSQIDTGPGDDLVKARDGTPEWIACGDGNDVVVAGAEDTVAADCENVSAGS